MTKNAMYWELESALGLYEIYPNPENWARVESAKSKLPKTSAVKRIINDMINTVRYEIWKFNAEMDQQKEHYEEHRLDDDDEEGYFE